MIIFIHAFGGHTIKIIIIVLSFYVFDIILFMQRV